MPHLRFRALENTYVAELSTVLPIKLAVAMGTTEDNFTFEADTSTYYAQGVVTTSYPFIEVLWFDRGQEAQDQSALIITDSIKKLGDFVDVIVVFRGLEKSVYYENGEHF